MNVCIYVTHVKVHRTRFADDFTARENARKVIYEPLLRAKNNALEDVACKKKRKETATEGRNGITTAEIVFDEEKEEEEVLSPLREVKGREGARPSL